MIENTKYLDFDSFDFEYYKAKTIQTEKFIFSKQAVCSYLFKEDKTEIDEIDLFTLETEILKSQKTDILNKYYGQKYSTNEFDFYLKDNFVNYICKKNCSEEELYSIDNVSDIIDSGYWYVYSYLRNNKDSFEEPFIQKIDDQIYFTKEALITLSNLIKNPYKQQRIKQYLNLDFESEKYITINEITKKTEFGRNYVFEKVSENLKNEIYYGDNNTIYLTKNNLEKLSQILTQEKNIKIEIKEEFTNIKNLVDDLNVCTRLFVKKYAQNETKIIDNEIYVSKKGILNIQNAISKPKKKDLEFSKKLEELCKSL